MLTHFQLALPFLCRVADEVWDKHLLLREPSDIGPQRRPVDIKYKIRFVVVRNDNTTTRALISVWPSRDHSSWTFIKNSVSDPMVIVNLIFLCSIHGSQQT